MIGATGLLYVLAAAVLPLSLAQSIVPYTPPAPATPDGPARPDGKAAVLTFAGLAPITVTPLLQPTTRMRQCAVRLTARDSGSQTVATLGVGETEALTCVGLKAFGRLPGPRGVARIGLIYRAASPNARVEAVVVLSRTVGDPRWSTDDKLADRLTYADNLATIASMRAYIRRHRL